MKKLFVLLSALIIGCNDQPTGESTIQTDKGYTIKVIDSCEYIEFDDGLFENRVYSLTHKGNCKFCTQRKRIYSF